MTGIVSYGAYVPYYRLSRTDISSMWGSPGGMGERSVANFDEDSVTMSVEAGTDCISGMDSKSIDGLYFASTTAPYLEKMSASIVAAALDFRMDVYASDFAGSLRGGTNAVRSAMDAINGGSADRVLVCAADVRMGFPKSSNEMNFGDGAAALLLGNTDVIASIEGWLSHCNEIMDVWRSDRDLFVRSWEARFVTQAGYLRVVPKAVEAALKKYKMTPDDFSKAIFCAPNPRLAKSAAAKSGFGPKTELQDSLDSVIGDTGTALPLMLLTSALEEAEAGDRILLACYGDGCDVLILRVTEQIKHFQKERGLKTYLPSKKMTSYDKLLRWREMLPVDPPARPPADQSRPSASALWRDAKGGLALYGVKCRNCGTPQYPAQRVCYKCRTKDDFDIYRFADKKAKLTSYSHDMLSAGLDPPITVCAVDFEGGGRIMCDMTDRDYKDVEVDMPVEMTFRRLYYGADFYAYWWKCRPLRSKAGVNL
jgi:hydroxymethylglutaryl-CoA synthase